MCQSQAEGGRRCYTHQRQRVDKLEHQLAEASPDTAEHEQISSRLETALADLTQTRTGLQEHITERTATGRPYDAEQLAETVNRYVADSPTGKPLTLPGGSFRVTRAHLARAHRSRGHRADVRAVVQQRPRGAIHPGRRREAGHSRYPH
jgi:cob(I)alamin adenosyltransferase